LHRPDRGERAATAQADDGNAVRIGANGRDWMATPVNWSDGRVSIIVVPETPDPALQSTDAAVAVQRYITQSGRDCTFDGVLHAVGPEVTGSSAGWAGSLSCKP
jgi:hypothetical protein